MSQPSHSSGNLDRQCLKRHRIFGGCPVQSSWCDLQPLNLKSAGSWRALLLQISLSCRQRTLASLLSVKHGRRLLKFDSEAAQNTSSQFDSLQEYEAVSTFESFHYTHNNINNVQIQHPENFRILFILSLSLLVHYFTGQVDVLQIRFLASNDLISHPGWCKMPAKCHVIAGIKPSNFLGASMALSQSIFFKWIEHRQRTSTHIYTKEMLPHRWCWLVEAGDVSSQKASQCIGYEIPPPWTPGCLLDIFMNCGPLEGNV